MKRNRQTYVAREMRRRRAEARYRFITKVSEAVSGVVLVVCSEAIMFAFLLM